MPSIPWSGSRAEVVVDKICGDKVVVDKVCGRCRFNSLPSVLEVIS